MLGRRGPLSKIIGGGVGLTQEYRANRAEHKENQQDDDVQTQSENYVDSDPNEDDDDEERARQLDEAQLQFTDGAIPESTSFDENDFITRFMNAHPPPAYEQQPENVLPMPVIIPQRHPGQKSRGFINAYAPVLQNAGIDEKTWMDFLQGFEKSIGKNGWFHALNIAVAVAGKIRLAVEGFSVIARFVTMAIHLSIEGGRRVFMNSKTNTYLDRMNEEFLKPRGLYALLITYKPNSDEPEETIDVNTNTIAQVADRDAENRAKWKNLLSSSAGKSEHEEDIPDFAPLVFPQLDNMDETQKQNAVKQFGSFMHEYMDKRAQAKFDAAHEDSKLAGLHPEHKFASRHADPNHPASQGGLVSTLSGGNIQYTGPLQKVTDRRNARRSKFGIGRTAGKEGRTEKKNKRPLRKFLTPNAVYLMVANYPSKEEQAAVLDELEEAKKSGNGQAHLEVGIIRKTLGLQGLGRKK